MIELLAIRHSYPENEGFYINRVQGHQDYTFLHFHNRVELTVKGHTVLTEPHAVILYRPRTPQYFKSPVPLVHDWMHFKSDITDWRERFGFECDKIYYPTNPALITEMMTEMEKEFFGGFDHAGRLLEIKSEELFIKFGRNLSEKASSAMNDTVSQKLSKLRGEVFSALDESWTVGLMAQRMCLSESRFYALYKMYFGISPIEDLIHAKINSAKNMLAYGDKSVEQIAEDLAYQNVTHFIRQFKERIGVSPAKYRKSFGSERNL